MDLSPYMETIIDLKREIKHLREAVADLRPCAQLAFEMLEKEIAQHEPNSIEWRCLQKQINAAGSAVTFAGRLLEQKRGES
jgi:hypothetical protein